MNKIFSSVISLALLTFASQSLYAASLQCPSSDKIKYISFKQAMHDSGDNRWYFKSWPIEDKGHTWYVWFGTPLKNADKYPADPLLDGIKEYQQTKLTNTNPVPERKDDFVSHCVYADWPEERVYILAASGLAEGV